MPTLHKSAESRGSPFPQTDSSHEFRDRDARRGVAAHDGDADLELGNLTVEVPRGRAVGFGQTRGTGPGNSGKADQRDSAPSMTSAWPVMNDDRSEAR